MKLFFLIFLSVALLPVNPLAAQDLGPVGPKSTNSGVGSKPGSEKKINVVLPYQPATEVEKVKKEKPGLSSAEPIVTETKKDVFIPRLPSKFPPTVGAPDLGI